MDIAFYERGGIQSEQMRAIAEQQIAELAAGDDDNLNPHLTGVIAEYRWIVDRFGMVQLAS